MTGIQIDELFDRLGRLVAATKEHAGSGTAWSYTFPGGETHRYVIRGLRSHAEVEDCAANLLIWIWNAKDYLKRRAESMGKSGDDIEIAINNDPFLPLCADLANGLKHGELDRSRSGRYPRLGKASFDVPGTAIGALTVGALEVEMQIADPSQAEFSLPVLDDAGIKIGDAFECARNGIVALERIRNEVEARP